MITSASPPALGVRAGRLADFVRAHAPFVMWFLPCTFGEVLGAVVGGLLGSRLVHGYLLQKGELSHAPLILVVAGEFLYWGAVGVYLLPVMRAHLLTRAGRQVPAPLHRKARNRIYNYPPFLILVTYGSWFLAMVALHFLLPVGRSLVVMMLAFLTTMLNAILVYYAADFLNRNYIVPHWFPDGKFPVRFRLRRPALMMRFMDLFFVNAFSPVAAIVLIIFVTMTYGPHDPKELERLLITCGVTGGVYWAFGLLMTHLTARTFSGPLNSLEAATSAIAEERFDVRVAVQSDDQLGRLQTAVNRMADELGRMHTVKTLFGHYVSPEIRDLILEGRVKTEGGERIEAVVLFTDIRAFTALSERHSPEALVDMLNIHFSRVVKAVSSHNGFVDKFIGDAVMAVFDAEFCAGKHRELSLQAAIDILRGMEGTNSLVTGRGFEPIEIGIGMACGPVIRGNIGSEDRRELTVMGDTVNTASRLESATKTVGHPLIVTRYGFGEICAALPGVQVIALEPLSIRGKSRAVEVVALRPETISAALPA